MLESLAVRRAEASTAITRVHEVLDAFAARDLNGETLTAVRHFPAREAQWADFPTWVNSDLAAAYAAKAGSTADDGNGDHSPFTASLLKNLTVPGLDVRLVHAKNGFRLSRI